jgi:hypothetical protein
MNNSPRDLLPRALLITAVVFFLVFHVSPVGSRFGHPGWYIWRSVSNSLINPSEISPAQGMRLSSFVVLAILVLFSPFLVAVWRQSVISRHLAIVSSGLAITGIVFFGVNETILIDHGSGDRCLVAASIFNFIGLLLSRSYSAQGQN